MVAGQVDKFGKSGQYDTYFLVFVPALIRQSATSSPKKFGSVAIGLSADLLSKINIKKDEGRYLSVELLEFEPTDKGSPKKIFEVNELSAEEFSRLESRATGDYKNNAYSKERDDVGADAPMDDDDLPF